MSVCLVNLPVNCYAGVFVTRLPASACFFFFTVMEFNAATLGFILKVRNVHGEKVAIQSSYSHRNVFQIHP